MSGWHQVTIDGKTADAFEPARPAQTGAAVLFLHGHGLITLRGNSVFTAELERFGLRCLCPHGKRSWWGDRICREFDAERAPVAYLRESAMPWFAKNWSTAPPGVALLGVAMGGQGVLRLAYRFPDEFPIVAALAPTIDLQNWHGRGFPIDEMYSDAESARQESATLHMHPLNWPRHQLLVCDPTDTMAFEGTERLAGKLNSTGIPFEQDFTTRHGGHSWEYFNHVAPRVMQFLNDSLDKERRRLPTLPATNVAR